MRRRLAFCVVLLAISARAGFGQWAGYIDNPEHLFNISPQLGWSTEKSERLVAGVVVSEYVRVDESWYLGAGLGAYLQGDAGMGEAMGKLGFAGILGASAGLSRSRRGWGFTNDLWVNFAIAGIRWRMEHADSRMVHAFTVFVPTGMYLR